MSNPFLGEIRVFAGNFAPRGYAMCSGQLLPINQNTALFAILGTTYGGDGTTTFALPDLRGRAPIGEGNGPGLSNYVLGETTGTESVTLTQANIPLHNHPLNAAATQTTAVPSSSVVLGITAGGVTAYANTTGVVALAAPSIGPQASSGLPHDNMQPYLALTYIIALEGIFPSRN